MASRRSAPTPIPVDPKLKAKWERLKGTITRAVERDASAFDERWEAAAKVLEHEPPLYVFGGHAKPEDFFRKVLHESRRNAYRFIRVAKYASPAEEATYGVHVIDRALSFLEAREGKPLGKSLPEPLAKIRIPIERGRKKGRASLTEVTVQEIEAATQKVLKQSGKARAAPKHARDRLARLFRDRPGLDGLQVSEARGFVTMSRVPLANWDAFKEAIAAAHYEELVGASPKKKPAKRRR